MSYAGVKSMIVGEVFISVILKTMPDVDAAEAKFMFRKSTMLMSMLGLMHMGKQLSWRRLIGMRLAPLVVFMINERVV